jgi:hypothetical protein
MGPLILRSAFGEVCGQLPEPAALLLGKEPSGTQWTREYTDSIAGQGLWKRDIFTASRIRTSIPQ